MTLNLKPTLLAAFTVTLGSIAALDAGQIFRDDFNGRRGARQGNQWEKETHAQGRGTFGKDAWLDGNGVAHISVARRNPSAPGRFLQTVIRTKRTFAPKPGRVLDFRIRAKITAENQRGIVFGFFTYNQFYFRNANRSNELDFEWLTNLTANRSQDTLLVSTWRDWNRDEPKYGIWNDFKHGTHRSETKALSANAGDWHTYTMRWGQGRVEFFRDNPINGKWVYLGGYYGAGVPTGAQRLFVNAWVPDSSWAQAYNAGLTPTNNASQNAYYTMLVDWVQVNDNPAPR